MLPAGLACALLLAAALEWERSAAPGPAPAAAEPAVESALAPERAPTAALSLRANAGEPALAHAEDEPPVPARKPGSHGDRKEREHYADCMRLGAADPLALESKAQALLTGASSDAEKVAALRAVLDVATPRRAQMLAQAALELPDTSHGGHVSVPWLAVECLRRKAGTDEQAREALHMVAWSPRAAPELRRNAAAALAASGKRADLERLERELARAESPAMRAAALAALAGNGDRPLAEWFHQRMGGDYPLPEAHSPPEE